jgi:hypothetical protein
VDRGDPRFGTQCWSTGRCITSRWNGPARRNGVRCGPTMLRCGLTSGRSVSIIRVGVLPAVVLSALQYIAVFRGGGRWPTLWWRFRYTPACAGCCCLSGASRFSWRMARGGESHQASGARMRSSLAAKCRLTHRCSGPAGTVSCTSRVGCAPAADRPHVIPDCNSPCSN